MGFINFIVQAKKQADAGGKPEIKFEDWFGEFVYEERGYRNSYHAGDSTLFWEECIYKLEYYGMSI